MRDRRDQHRRRIGGLSEHIGEADETVGHFTPGKRRARVQGIDDLVVLAGPTEGIWLLEAVRGQGVQVCKHLERRALPGINLARHRGGHGQGGGHRTTERRVIEARAYDIEGDISPLECCRVTGTRESRVRSYLCCASAHAAIPEQAIDLAPGRVACLADAREPGEGGEGIAQ